MKWIKKKDHQFFKHPFYQLKKPQATCRTTSIPDIVPIRPKSVRLWSKFHILHLERNFQTSSQRLRPQHLTAFLSSNHQKNNKSKEACPWELIKMRRWNSFSAKKMDSLKNRWSGKREMSRTIYFSPHARTEILNIGFRGSGKRCCFPGQRQNPPNPQPKQAYTYQQSL